MYNYFAAYIVVTDVEFAAAERLYRWEPVYFQDTCAIFYEASFYRGGKEYKVCMARQARMGMVCAASLATEIIYRFNPQYLIMGGIAAGIGSGQIFGDVLLADMFWDYSMGKYVAKGHGEISYGEVDFDPRPHCIYVPDHLLETFKEAIQDETNEYKVFLGPLACGASVVANSNLKNAQVLNQYGATIGLDMESYAVAYAAMFVRKHGPLPVVAKSVCDFANEQKNDGYQKLAAYTSCNFLKYLCEKHLRDRMGEDIE